MKAIQYTNYGDPGVLKLVEKPKPVPGPRRVLIEVKAASINSWDWDMIRGKPWFVRMWGVFKPRFTIPGADVAGVVESVGPGVTRFKPGDRVFGDLSDCGWGGFAGFCVAPEKALELIPKGVPFEAAASLPQAGLMALQSLWKKAGVRKGQRVLINGAGGGVGTFAIQLAKLSGASVTAVDSLSKLPALHDLGADVTVDYARQDYTQLEVKYDCIIDVVADKSLFRYKRVLNTGGQFIMIGGRSSSILQAMVLGRWTSRGDDRSLGILAYRPNEGLDELGKLCANRKIAPVIDRTYPLSATAEAFRHYASGTVLGKVIITP